MTPRGLSVWVALMAALVIPVSAAFANDHEDSSHHADSAAPPQAESSTPEPALAEPSAPEPSHPEAAPPESAHSDYSSSESYPSDDGEARSESPAPAASPRSYEEERPAEENSGKKGKKAKPYDYERSKYKSRELSENTTKIYRFNEKGEPVVPAEKKKPVAKKKKRRGSEPKLTPESCGSAESCAEKKSDADAL